MRRFVYEDPPPLSTLVPDHLSFLYLVLLAYIGKVSLPVSTAFLPLFFLFPSRTLPWDLFPSQDERVHQLHVGSQVPDSSNLRDSLGSARLLCSLRHLDLINICNSQSFVSLPPQIGLLSFSPIIQNPSL